MKKYSYDAVIFDLDGVITQTALVHSRAWKAMFDGFLKTYYERHRLPFLEFRHDPDYLNYVDGRPRYEGVRTFLESRNIRLEFGDPEDSGDQETICGLGNRKNDAFNEVLRQEGVKTYPSTVAFMEQLKAAGIHIGVASSSKNCEAVLEAAGLMHFVETRVDGVVSAAMGLKGKPEPDIFLTAAANLGVKPDRAVVVEDASSGVAAGRKGNFGLVVGLAREDNRQELLEQGADVVFADMAETGLDAIQHWFEKGREEDSWVLTYYGYDHAKERSRESLLCVGNGYMATRGVQEECPAGASHYPGTYIAGLYNRMMTTVSGKDIENEDFVNIPNYLPIRFRVEDGEWMDVDKVRIISMKRSLDFRTGLLSRETDVEDAAGRRSRIRSERMISMHQPHLAMLRYTLTPLNYSGRIEFEYGLDGSVINGGVERYKSLNQRHLKALYANAEGHQQHLVMETSQSAVRIALVAEHRITKNENVLSANSHHTVQEDRVFSTLLTNLGAGESCCIEKRVAIYTSRPDDTPDPHARAVECLQKTSAFEAEVRLSAAAWQKILDAVNIRVSGDRRSQKLLRLNTWHMLVSMSPHNETLDAGITARGLHGEAYRGHVFWDEIFVIPWYSLVLPKVARSMLMYRYRRLEAARKYASDHGYSGAMFPWQSGSDGREETQVIHLNPLSGQWDPDYSCLQRHVSLAIAYNVWQYYKSTADVGFMRDFGAEMFLEIARFWTSKAVYNPETDRYDISGVMGPDEFHEHGPDSPGGGVSNNAYTNLMVAWMLAKIPEIRTLGGAELLRKTGVGEEEFVKMEALSGKLSLHINEEGIIAQYKGYFELEELDWQSYREKYINVYRMDRILKSEGKSPDHYKVAKQADVLMTFYNLDKPEVDGLLTKLGYSLPEDYLERNLRYYLARTSHGSTLSRLVHGKLGLMAGDVELGETLYFDALGSDFTDIQGGTTGEGIHAGVMCGSLFEAMTTFGGLQLNGDSLKLKPNLPAGWEGIAFRVKFQGHEYHIDLKKQPD